MHANVRPHTRHHAQRRGTRTVIAAAISMLLLGEVQAAPGTLAESPLFLESSVQSNIFLMVDDSGSMNWEVLLTRGADIAHPDDPDSVNGLDFTPDTINASNDTPDGNSQMEERRLCAGYNGMAYNPTRTYTPWQGVDSADVTYTDAILTAARVNPYSAAAGTRNLSNHYYFLWNDANADGVYQDGECPTHADDAANTASECTSFGSTVCQRVSSLSAAEQTNYANWYSYYRKREYGAKRALSSVIIDSSARMGLATLWDNDPGHGDDGHVHNGVRTPIRDIDDITTPIDTTAQTNKNTLLDSLFRIDSRNGTPLRRALQNAGIYFETGQVAAWGADWTSPILSEAEGGACQQNFTILMSDGFWNTDTDTEITAENADADGTGEWDGDSYADTYSDTLADVAMYYFERDLSAALPNQVRLTAGDQNPAQHMVTFTVAFGLNGTLAAGPTSTTAPFAWPQPVADTATALDDMIHAAWNGRGQFLSASDPNELATSLAEAIADIDARSGSAAAVSFNSTSLQNDTMIFQAVFDSDNWSGNLNAIPIDEDGVVGATAWTATAGAASDSNGLDERSHTLRTFYSYDGTDGITLDWANLTTAQKDDFKLNPNGTVADDATGMARLGFIKGDRACEETGTGTCSYSDSVNTYTTKAFRDRDSSLGDIVHSSPLFVGAPSTPYPDDIESTAYSTFVNSAAKNRQQIVYVGANDGMLHAFDTENSGRELFTYVPNFLFSDAAGNGLHYLSDPTYLHKWYVDLSATAADVYLSSAWKTLLIGGLRGGGKGLFALDITDPETFAASDVLWEFTDANLGYTFSEIRVGKLNNGKWAAIFGNGYNSDPTGDGSAKLFIVYLDGTNLSTPVIIDTGAGSIASGDCGNATSDCNGLSSPALADLNGDGIIDRAYAGDLHGNMWAFDLSSSTTTDWEPAYGATPLAHACTSATCTGNRQPITSRPSLARHKTKRSASTSPNLMVFFGTGQYLAVNDNDSTLQQTYYGVWDSGSGGVKRGTLREQTIGPDTVTDDEGVTHNVRTLSENTVNYSTQDGWFIELPTTKERVVTGSTAIGDLVFFNTMIPSTSVCGYGGSGWLMLASQLDGSAPNFGAVDVNGDGVIDEDDLTALGDFVAGVQTTGIPTESRFISNKRVTTDSSGAVKVDTVEPFENNAPARTSWTPIEY